MGNSQVFQHRLPAICVATISTVSLALSSGAGASCSFVQIRSSDSHAYPPGYDSYIPDEIAGDNVDFIDPPPPHFGIGLFCSSPFYSRSGDKMWNVARAFLIMSLALSSSCNIFAWAISTFYRPTERKWKVISLLAAFGGVFQIPAFLLLEAKPCKEASGYHCSIGEGSFLLICSTFCSLTVAILTQILDCPQWAEVLDMWKVDQKRISLQSENLVDRSILDRQGLLRDDSLARHNISNKYKKKTYSFQSIQNWWYSRKFGNLKHISITEDLDDQHDEEILNNDQRSCAMMVDLAPVASKDLEDEQKISSSNLSTLENGFGAPPKPDESYYAESVNSRLMLHVSPNGRQLGDERQSEHSFACSLEEDIRFAELERKKDGNKICSNNSFSQISHDPNQKCEMQYMSPGINRRAASDSRKSTPLMKNTSKAVNQIDFASQDKIDLKLTVKSPDSDAFQFSPSVQASTGHKPAHLKIYTDIDLLPPPYKTDIPTQDLLDNKHRADKRIERNLFLSTKVSPRVIGDKVNSSVRAVTNAFTFMNRLKGDAMESEENIRTDQMMKKKQNGQYNNLSDSSDVVSNHSSILKTYSNEELSAFEKNSCHDIKAACRKSESVDEFEAESHLKNKDNPQDIILGTADVMEGFHIKDNTLQLGPTSEKVTSEDNERKKTLEIDIFQKAVAAGACAALVSNNQDDEEPPLQYYSSDDDSETSTLSASTHQSSQYNAHRLNKEQSSIGDEGYSDSEHKHIIAQVKNNQDIRKEKKRSSSQRLRKKRRRKSSRSKSCARSISSKVSLLTLTIDEETDFDLEMEAQSGDEHASKPSSIIVKPIFTSLDPKKEKINLISPINDGFEDGYLARSVKSCESSKIYSNKNGSPRKSHYKSIKDDEMQTVRPSVPSASSDGGDESVRAHSRASRRKKRRPRSRSSTRLKAQVLPVISPKEEIGLNVEADDSQSRSRYPIIVVQGKTSWREEKLYESAVHNTAAAAVSDYSSSDDDNKSYRSSMSNCIRVARKRRLQRESFGRSKSRTHKKVTNGGSIITVTSIVDTYGSDEASL